MKKFWILIIVICMMLILLNTNELWQVIIGGVTAFFLLSGWACLKIASENDDELHGKEEKDDGSKEVLESTEKTGHAD